MKKFIAVVLSIIPLALCLCGFKLKVIEKQNNGELSCPAIIGWNDDGETFDVAISINFDKIDINKVFSITFELFENENLIAKKKSIGKRKDNLLNKFAKEWNCDETSYKNVHGVKVLTCSFKEQQESDDCWVTSENNLTASTNITKLVVSLVDCENNTYTTRSCSE